VDVCAERVVAWPDLRCEGPPEPLGEPLPGGPPEPQAPPKGGTAPRVDAARAGRRIGALPFVLLAYVQADGRPAALPVEVAGAGEEGVELRAAPGVIPPGSRRAGLLGHAYRPKLIGLEARQCTGWLEADEGRALYAPHTESGFKAPPNKTLLLLFNGLLAKRGVRQARREGKLPAG
jgi:hypothetical protein